MTEGDRERIEAELRRSLDEAGQAAFSLVEVHKRELEAAAHENNVLMAENMRLRIENGNKTAEICNLTERTEELTYNLTRKANEQCAKARDEADKQMSGMEEERRELLRQVTISNLKMAAREKEFREEKEKFSQQMKDAEGEIEKLRREVTSLEEINRLKTEECLKAQKYVSLVKNFGQDLSRIEDRGDLTPSETNCSKQGLPATTVDTKTEHSEESIPAKQARAENREGEEAMDSLDTVPVYEGIPIDGLSEFVVDSREISLSEQLVKMDEIVSLVRPDEKEQVASREEGEEETESTVCPTDAPLSSLLSPAPLPATTPATNGLAFDRYFETVRDTFDAMYADQSEEAKKAMAREGKEWREMTQEDKEFYETERDLAGFAKVWNCLREVISTPNCQKLVDAEGEKKKLMREWSRMSDAQREEYMTTATRQRSEKEEKSTPVPPTPPTPPTTSRSNSVLNRISAEDSLFIVRSILSKNTEFPGFLDIINPSPETRDQLATSMTKLVQAVNAAHKKELTAGNINSHVHHLHNLVKEGLARSERRQSHPFFASIKRLDEEMHKNDQSAAIPKNSSKGDEKEENQLESAVGSQMGETLDAPFPRRSSRKRRNASSIDNPRRRPEPTLDSVLSAQMMFGPVSSDEE